MKLENKFAKKKWRTFLSEKAPRLKHLDDSATLGTDWETEVLIK